MSYLQRRGGGVYYFRIAVPLSARTAIGRREICFSLETRNRTEARLKSLPHIERYLLEFQQAGRSPVQPSPVVKAEPLRAGVTLLDVAERYLLERKLGHGSEKNLKTVISRFIEIIGNKDIRLYTKKDIIAFKDTLARYPWRVPDEDKGLSVEKIIKKHAKSRKIAPKTINDNYIGFIRVLFNYAVINDHCVNNPAIGVRMLNGEDKKDVKRLPFTAGQIQQNILESDLFRVKQNDRKMEYRWLILLGIYTGARVEELACLRMEDIGVEDDIPFIIIQPYKDHSLKTACSRRRVPIHPRLMREFGLNEYLKERRHEKFLFPLMNDEKQKVVSKNFTAWFSRWLDKAGLSDPRLCFHSFRHTFKSFGRSSGVEAGLLDALQGHAMRSVAMDYGRDAYGSPYPLKTLYEGLLKIDELNKLQPPR